MNVFHRLPPADARRPCALTIGNFDGVHRGHQALIAALVAEARAADLPSCVLTFEPHPREYFAARASAAGQQTTAPVRIANLRDKLEALASFGIDRVCVAHFNPSLAAMEAQRFVSDYLALGLHARRLLIGDDFRFGARRAGDFALLQRHCPPAGITVSAMATVRESGHRISSSLVREALAGADFDRVESLLGRPYRISGRVIHGRKLGRELGFPTLNLRFPHGRPALTGIFVVRVAGIDGDRALPGVASFGTRPAVEADGRYLLEVHLLDWRGNAYGKLARVEFIRKLRDERSFPGLAELTRAITDDVRSARSHFADADDRAPSPLAP